MERFHFCLASEFMGPLPSCNFWNDQIDKEVAGFVFNLLRIQSLGRLPILLTGASIVTQTFDMLAKFELGIPENDPTTMIGHPNFDQSRHAKKEKLRKEKHKRWFADAQAGKVASGMTVGEYALNLMVPAGGSETAEGIDATLNAMVTEMWTAFEVLAAGLWGAADAARPKLKKSLQGQKNVGLRSTLGIRRRYAFTFSVDNTAILKAVNDSKIEALALVRNIIVHLGDRRDSESTQGERPYPNWAIFFQRMLPKKSN